MKIDDSSTNSNNVGAVLLKQSQVADMMQICERQVFELRRTGMLATVKIGNAKRFLPEDVMECIQKLRKGNGR